MLEYNDGTLGEIKPIDELLELFITGDNVKSIHIGNKTQLEEIAQNQKYLNKKRGK